MISEGTTVRVIDNSGPTEGRCIKILWPKSGYGRRIGRVGDLIVMVVVRTSPGSKIKKGEVVRALIVRTVGGTDTIRAEKNTNTNNGEVLGKRTGIAGKRERFDENSVVLIKQGAVGGGGRIKRIREITPIGTRIKGPISEIVRLNKNNEKVLSIIA